MKSKHKMSDNLANFFPPEDNERLPSLMEVGGKGMNLAILAHAGLPVPNGFVLTTQSYQAHIAPKLKNEIADALQSLADGDGDDVGHNERIQAVEQVGANLRRRFVEEPLPINVASTIKSALERAFSSDPECQLAVRSSATAEDLPTFSFAGQHDSYLNIACEQAAVEDEVRRCWASLWTDRALHYRARNGIDALTVSLAVVIQKMAPARSAGVMFTVDPVSGDPNQAIVDSTHGLGEALVAGQVNPDHFRVDKAAHRVVECQLAEPDRPSLVDCEVLRLVEYGERIAAVFENRPQDVEWAVGTDSSFYILQARPITTLIEPPPKPLDVVEGQTADELRVFMCSSHHQGMMDPMTPMGVAIWGEVVTTLLFTVARQPLPDDLRRGPGYMVAESACRGWYNITPALRSPLPIAHMLSRVMSPSIGDALRHVQSSDPNLRRRVKNSVIFLWAIFMLVLNSLPVIFTGIFWPVKSVKSTREYISRLSKGFLKKPSLPIGPKFSKDLINPLMKTMFPLSMVGGMAFFLLKLIAPTKKLKEDALHLLSAARNNVTTEMSHKIWEISQKHRDLLIKDYEGNKTDIKVWILNHPDIALDLADFMEVYGHRGTLEIDCGREKFSENPKQVLDIALAFAKDSNGGPEMAHQKAKLNSGKCLSFTILRGSIPGAMNIDVVDECIQASDSDAFNMCRRLAESLGMLVGGSGGFNVHVALEVANNLQCDGTVVTLFPDSGIKYLSKVYSDDWLSGNKIVISRPSVRRARRVDAARDIAVEIAQTHDFNLVGFSSSSEDDNNDDGDDEGSGEAAAAGSTEGQAPKAGGTATKANGNDSGSAHVPRGGRRPSLEDSTSRSIRRAMVSAEEEAEAQRLASETRAADAAGAPPSHKTQPSRGAEIFYTRSETIGPPAATKNKKKKLTK